jgi:predicted nuclease of restriction endonuclease-like (RecB) superfamily
MKNMRIFAEEWASDLEGNRQTVSADLSEKKDVDTDSLIRLILSAELGEFKMLAFCRVGFSHHREILRKCQSSEERWYYILRCADEFWSYRSLKDHLLADDYAKYGSLPNNFALTIPDEKTVAMAMSSFKDEYLIDYIDITKFDDYTERDVEDGIAANVKKFIMTAVDGFAFIGNQYRLLVDSEEFFVDLLFFNRNLNCLVAFELKKDKFRPADLGQLSFYLSALDLYVRKPSENNSIGIPLCQEMNRTVAEIAVRDYDKPLGVVTYKLGMDIPDRYKSLIPLINGVQQIVSEGEAEE